MSSGLRRGEIYRVRQPQHGDPKKSRCFTVVSRQLISGAPTLVTNAFISSKSGRWGERTLP